MAALPGFASHGSSLLRGAARLPIVKAPGCLRHQTSTSQVIIFFKLATIIILSLPETNQDYFCLRVVLNVVNLFLSTLIFACFNLTEDEGEEEEGESSENESESESSASSKSSESESEAS